MGAARVAVAVTLAVALVQMHGCSGTTVETTPLEPPEAEEIWPEPPADSELSRVRAGMSQQDVMDLLGPPARITNETALGSPEAARASTPRTYYVYEGLGEVVFSSAAGGATAALGVYPAPPTGP